ncbi:hypothetical protein EON64_20970 [archaeon]|nr:MAG: hypothetical protein EON64_20970 [archaeon]
MDEKKRESSSVCKHFALGKTCRLGSRCRFLHHEEIACNVRIAKSSNTGSGRVLAFFSLVLPCHYLLHPVY